MSYTNGLDKPSDYFNTVLYTGNFSNNHSITGVGFKPDLVWTKNRTDGGEWHSWFDVIRGVTKRIYSNETNAEETAPNSLIRQSKKLNFPLNKIAIHIDIKRMEACEGLKES